MAWEVLGPLSLGFALSAPSVRWSPHKPMVRLLSDDTLFVKGRAWSQGPLSAKPRRAQALPTSPGVTRPSRTACKAAWVRLCKPSLLRRLLT